MKRTYIKRGIQHLGGRKKRKRGLLPILGTFARPVLVSAADAVGGEVLKRLEKKKKLRGREKEDLEEEDER